MRTGSPLELLSVASKYAMAPRQSQPDKHTDAIIMNISSGSANSGSRSQCSPSSSDWAQLPSP